MRLLMIEDDLQVYQGLQPLFKKNGIRCDISRFCEEGVEMFRNWDYDAVITDLILPDGAGNKLIQKIRVFFQNGKKANIPIIVISGRSTVDDKVEAFVCGADDYLTKPFEQRELIARIHSAIRRSKGYTMNVIKIKNLEINIEAKTVNVYGESIPLTNKEYILLEYLLLRRGSTVKKECILDHMYGGVKTPTQKIIDVLICKLRKKLLIESIKVNKNATEDEYIKTVWGLGYSFRPKDNLPINEINNIENSDLGLLVTA